MADFLLSVSWIVEAAFSFISAFGPLVLVLMFLGLAYWIVYLICDWYVSRRP